MVSICILNWNRVGELKKTVKIVEKLKIPYELIIFDQNSTDGSIEYLKEIQSDLIKPIFSPKNIGNSLSRNKMIQVAKYDFIILLDGDIVPIENSIEEMYYFMNKNPEYCILGYDCENHTTNLEEITHYEKGIELEQIIEIRRIALTQYGIFRKDVLLKVPFPTFYPFDREGWGAEDDLVGLTIVDNNLGKIGMIIGRTYFHNHPKSSWDLLGLENARYWYALRYLHYSYFCWFLNGEKKLKALQQGKLPTSKVDLYKYFWKYQNNLGDIATDYIFKQLIPFIEFNEESKNLFFFGGSIFNHLNNASSERPGIDIQKVEMFGVGISCDREADIPLSTDLKIYPRGKKTYEILKEKGFEPDEPVGDVLQLFTLLYPKSFEKGNDKTLYIRDAYSKVFDIPENEKSIKVALNSFSNEFSEEFVDLENFIILCQEYSHLYSSQIHPFLIPLMLGRGATVVPKDYRVKDLEFFDSFKKSMDNETAIEFRIHVLSKIPLFVWQLFSILSKYKIDS